MIDDRLQELEIRYTLQQDLLLELSDVVARQQRELDRLRGELDLLRKRIDADPAPFDPDEKPPHY